MDQYVDGMNWMYEVSGSISGWMKWINEVSGSIRRWDELDGRGKWINKWMG